MNEVFVIFQLMQTKSSKQNICEIKREMVTYVLTYKFTHGIYVLFIELAL